MKTVLLAAGVAGLLSVMSFRWNKAPAGQALTGTYGVCDCEKGNSSAPKLVLNPDNTYHYTDFTNAGKRIDVQGEWKLSDHTIYLHQPPTAPPVAFHNKWNIDNNTFCLKSRKGMAFYRLCNIRKVCD